MYGIGCLCFERKLMKEANMRTPILEKARLLLRPFCEEDEKDVFECWESDPDVAKFMF